MWEGVCVVVVDVVVVVVVGVVLVVVVGCVVVVLYSPSPSALPHLHAPGQKGGKLLAKWDSQSRVSQACGLAHRRARRVKFGE